MTLLISVFAAVGSAVLWYIKSPNDKYHTGLLALMYTASSVMWLVDLAVEFANEGSACFYPTANEMLNDTFLGLACVALGLVIWFVYLFVKDPKQVRKSMFKNK